MEAPLLHLALVGTPNSGKTSLFNALTGSRQKVANYPGVTFCRLPVRALNSEVLPLLGVPTRARCSRGNSMGSQAWGGYPVAG